MSLELDERLLDDPDALAAADLAGMLRTIAGSGAQVREASTLVGEADVESLSDERPRAVVLSAVSLDEMALAADRLDATAEACRPSSESFVNPAKRLAIDIAGALPVIWGAGGLCRVAAKRFARQLHANAKYPALDGGLQEAAHGTVALFDGLFATTTPEDVFRDPFDDESPRTMPLRVVLMRDAPDSETDTDAGLRRAAEYLAGERGVRTSQVAADNGLPFERLAQLIAFGDFASVYLAPVSYTHLRAHETGRN